MAVQAHRLLPTGAHASRAGGGVVGGGGAMGDVVPQFLQGQASYSYGGAGDVAGGGVRGFGAQQGYGSSPYVGLVAPPPPAAVAAVVAGLGQQWSQSQQFCCAPTDASESGVTFGGGCPVALPEVASRKRRRYDDRPAFLAGAAEVAAHAQQQLMDVDRVVLHHAAKMWVMLADERRRQVVAAVEAAAAKRLKVKDDEISRIGRLNWALEERLRSLYLEAQVWRDMAHSNEAKANALRGELEQALDAQARHRADAGDDAESCCYGENDVAVNGDGVGAGGEVEVRSAAAAAGDRRACRGCGERAAAVLLLPCRHLCTCAACAAAARECPACGCAKNGSVCVNFS